MNIARFDIRQVSLRAWKWASENHKSYPNEYQPVRFWMLYQKYLCPCALDESGLSIGRVKGSLELELEFIATFLSFLSRLLLGMCLQLL